MGKAAQSQLRLLDAATVEFAAYGIAGARVDRIASSANVNKARLYAWYRSKDELFDAVLSKHLMRILDAVPLTADDLPGYAERLYDAYLENPDMVRLSAWARLERVPSGDLFAGLNENHDERKLRAITDAQSNGIIHPDLDPNDVHSLVIALSMTWSPLSMHIAATSTEDPRIHIRRKRALAQAVKFAFAPQS